MTELSRADFKAVIFDLDGTLLDTVPDSHAALNRILIEDGLRSLSLDEVHSIVGEGARSMLARARALAGKPVAPANVEELERRYLAAYLADPIGHTVIYPGAFDLLKELDAVGYAMAICTNKPRVTTLKVLAALGLETFFDAVMCPEDVAYRKPDRRHVLATVRALSVGIREVVFVGDSETDIIAASDAGVLSILVNWGYCHVPRETLPADMRIDHLNQLPQALSTLAAQRV
jgi:phosphoglycolate phosphatase